MFDFVLASANVPFAAALTLVLIIAFFEGVGLVLGVGLSNTLDALIPEFDINTNVEVAEVGSNSALSRLLGWLRVGRVPILMLLIVLLFSFGSIGYIINLVCVDIVGALAPKIVSVPLAICGALPVTRWGGAALEAILPKDETSSVSLDSLVGRQAFITLGQATHAAAAEAKVRDQHGKTHYVMVRAEDGHGPFKSGVPLLLVRRLNNQFIVIEAEGSSLDE